MSEYQVGKDIQDLLNRIERLEKILGPEDDFEINDVESIIKISFKEVTKDTKTVTGYVNGEKREISVKFGENEHCTWGWSYIGSVTSFNTVLEDIPGDGPAVGCVSEWNPGTNGPMMGNAVFYELSTNRSPGAIRVIGRSSYGNALPCGVGFIAYKSRD